MTASAPSFHRTIAIVLVAVSARALLDYGGLARRLAGRTLLDRGTIASSEWEDFLARAGRPRVRAAYAHAKEAGSLSSQSSGVASGWRWIVSSEGSLPPDARVYLNVPSELLLYYGNTLWYPRRLEFGAPRATIADGEALRAAAVRVDARELPELRSAGFTHIVTATSEGLRLIDLRVTPPGPAR